MLKRNKILLLLFSLILLSSITIVSATNNTNTSSNIVNDLKLEDNSFNNNYYFNAGASNDEGNGSIDKPWKTINNNRINSITNNSQVHISKGSYNIKENITFKNNMNVIGENNQNTKFYIINESQIFINKDTNINISNINFTEEYNPKLENHVSSIVNNGTLNLNNTIFENNYGNDGGAIANYGNLVVNNSEFTKNLANMQGGAIYNKALTSDNYFHIYNSIFSRNYIIHNSYLLNFYYGGSAIYTTKTTSIIDNSTFINNNIDPILDETFGGALVFKNCILNISNSEFINNSASIGGSIFITNSEINIDSCTFINSTALSGFGGAATIQNSSLTIQKTEFNNCKSLKNIGGALMVYLENNNIEHLDKILSININKCNFLDNSAYYGGAICVLGTVNNTPTKKIVDYLDGVIPAIININNTKFIFNTASFDGGAIYSMYSNITSSNNMFYYNKITSNKSLGSTIFAYRGNLTIEKSVILDNNTISYAIYNYENDLNITNSIFKTSKSIDNTPYIRLNTTKSKFIIENNWWSDNNPNWKQLLNNVENIPKTWAIMSFINTTPLNESAINLTVSLNTLNNNNTVNLPCTIVYFTASNGRFNKDIILLNKIENNTFYGKAGDIIATINGYSIKLTNKEIPTIITNNITSKPGKIIQITANINNDANGYAIIKINDNTISPKIRIQNGQITYNYTISSNWSIKDYKITIKYSGDNKYRNSSINARLNLEKTNTIITVKPIITTHNTITILEAEIRNDQEYLITSGNIVFKINNKTISPKIQVTNGIAQYNYTTPKQEKTYSLTVVYSGNSQTNSAKNYTKLIVTKNNSNNIQTYTTTENQKIILPESYDLRNLSLITPIKDQKGKGACWAFGMISSLESHLLKTENKTYNLSENHMQNLMGLYSLIGTNTFSGGFDYISIGYLASWLGPVNSTSDPYYDFNMISPKIDEIFHIQDIIINSPRQNSTDNNRIKESLILYGAVTTGYYADSIHYNPKTYSFYCNETIPSDHEVSIIGWDDNYDKNNFNIVPPGNGAFIVRNSWGTIFGDQGYFYVSYYDNNFAREIVNAAIINIEPVNNYDHNYQYEIIQDTNKTYEKDNVWYANQFTSKQDETVEAVSTYFIGSNEYNYQIQVYVNNQLKYTQNGNSTISSYKTIKLDQKINLNKNDQFKIVIKLETPNSIATIPIQANGFRYNNENNFNKAVFTPNSSFISPDGIHWEDIAYSTEYINANVCIKAFTKDR
ncbi:MAG: lectin like domain-containing protein [Methanobacteriaceae archaeon]|nr:lectin like domain-containing protein [Methanobacteriaceae archaeon]